MGVEMTDWKTIPRDGQSPTEESKEFTWRGGVGKAVRRSGRKFESHVGAAKTLTGLQIILFISQMNFTIIPEKSRGLAKVTKQGS